MRASASAVKRAFGFFAAAAALDLLLYAPSLRGGFVSDDLIYLESNPTLRLPLGQALPRLLASPYFANWAPLHHALLYLEWQLFGETPIGYRLVNVLLHAGCACALAAAARRAGLSRRAAGLAGLLLLLHPAAVEAVAWINQSKTLLALLFGLLALERWLAHLEAPGAGRLATALALAVLSLLAKAALVLLPGVFAVALLADAPRGRRELVPLAALSLLAATVLWENLVAQASQGGVVSWYGGSFAATARVLPGVLWRYLRLGLLPYDPVFGVDPSVPGRWSDPQAWLPAAGVTAALVAGVPLVRRDPRFGLALAWWVAALLPVVQLVPMTTIFADRYLVMALPGLLAPAAAGIDGLWARVGGRARVCLATALALGLSSLAAKTFHQARLWAEPERLFAEATAAYPEGRIGWIGLGAERQKRGDLSGAADAYRRALRSVNDQGDVWLLLGRVRLSEGWLGAALYDLEKGVRIAPTHPDAAWARETAARLRARGVEPEEDGR